MLCQISGYCFFGHIVQSNHQSVCHSGSSASIRYTSTVRRRWLKDGGSPQRRWRLLLPAVCVMFHRQAPTSCWSSAGLLTTGRDEIRDMKKYPYSPCCLHAHGSNNMIINMRAERETERETERERQRERERERDFYSHTINCLLMLLFWKRQNWLGCSPGKLEWILH